MAIKVKHEGNVTSRVYAAAAGGKGRRQSEDAKLLMSSAGRGGGGGGTGGGARAGGNAPTISAPTSRAALGSSGSLVSPPSLTMAGRRELQETSDKAAAERQEREFAFRMSEGEKTRQAAKERQESEQNWRTDMTDQARRAEEEARLAAETRMMTRNDLRRRGFTDQQIVDIEQVRAKKASIQADKSLTEEERTSAMSAVDSELDAFKPILSEQPDPNDPNNAVRPVTLADGRQVYLMRNARGDWSEFTPQSVGDERRAAEREEENRAKAEAKRNDYILKRVTEMEGNHSLYGDESGAFDRRAAIAAAGEEYDAVYGGGASGHSAPPPPSRAPAGEVKPVKPMTAEEARKKYLVGNKKDEDKQF